MKMSKDVVDNQKIFLAYIPPHLRGGGGSNQRSADSGYQDNYGGRGGGRGMFLATAVMPC
jgi:hypothetical protein